MQKITAFTGKTPLPGLDPNVEKTIKEKREALAEEMYLKELRKRGEDQLKNVDARAKAQSEIINEKAKELEASEKRITELQAVLNKSQIEYREGKSINEVNAILNNLNQTLAERLRTALTTTLPDYSKEQLETLIKALRAMPESETTDKYIRYVESIILMQLETNRRNTAAAIHAAAIFDQKKATVEIESTKEMMGRLAGMTGTAAGNMKSLSDEIQTLVKIIQEGKKYLETAKPKAFGGGVDTIPAWLSPGEFVVNANATRKFLPQLVAINSGSAPRFANGGQVGNFSVGEININESSSPQLTAREIGRALHQEIRRGTIPNLTRSN
jgi:hypothetical protein